jgi:outer membrane protein
MIIWLTGLMPALFLFGCAVNQAREVKIYRDVLDGPDTAAVESFYPEAPLTLAAAMKLANIHNERLAIAGENYLQALIDKDRAFAAFLPTISFAPVFMRQERTDLGGGDSLISEFVKNKTTDVTVAGNMNLHPFRDVPAVRAAGSSVRMQKALLLEQQSILMLDVARTYYQVMHAEAAVKVLAQTIDVDNRRLADIRVKQKAGVARPMDVSLAQAQLAGTRNQLIQAQNDVNNGRAMLALLMGVGEVSGPLVNGLDIPEDAGQVETLQKTADSHRQDLLAAREQLRVAAAALEAAWGEYFPSVSLNLTSYLSRDSFPGDVDWTSMIRVNVPIFSAGLIHADVRSAYSRLRQARLAEMYTQRQVGKELKTALEDLGRDDRQIEQLEIQVKAAEDGLKQAEAAFKTGRGTYLEQLTAREGLLSARLALSDAGFNRCVDYLRLLQATGTLTPDPSVIVSSGENGNHQSEDE